MVIGMARQLTFVGRTIPEISIIDQPFIRIKSSTCTDKTSNACTTYHCRLHVKGTQWEISVSRTSPSVQFSGLSRGLKLAIHINLLERSYKAASWDAMYMYLLQSFAFYKYYSESAPCWL